MTDATPSYDQVVKALISIRQGRTAKHLCDKLVADGFEKSDCQLAIQRAIDHNFITVDDDWSLRVAINVHQKLAKRKAEEAFNKVPEYIRHDLVEAAVWARETLTKHEGEGHVFQLHGDDLGLCCSFAKPEWNADHVGSYKDEASEAIVIAVCEYLEGL